MANLISLTNDGSTASQANIDTRGTGLKGIVQVDKGDTNVSLCASVDGDTFFVLKTFSADTIEEVLLFPHFKINGAADVTFDDSVGTSTLKIFFDNKAFDKGR